MKILNYLRYYENDLYNEYKECLDYYGGEHIETLLAAKAWEVSRNILNEITLYYKEELSRENNR